MLKKDNCLYNEPYQSFFGHIKNEIDYKNCINFNKLQKITDDYLEYCNNYRCQ